MTRFCSFASGSSGNAALLSCGGVHVLIDLGISCRRTCRCLESMGLRPEDLACVLITHEHADHIAGLATWLKKYRVPILCTPGTARQLAYRLAGISDLLRTVGPWEAAVVGGGVTATALPTSHDCAQGCGFGVRGPDGLFCLYTDTGVVPDQRTRDFLAGAHTLVLESNYDEDMLLAGPYPFPLKERILGAQGHLSNLDAAEVARACAGAGTRTILLAHLSAENNAPRRALDTVGAPLAAMGWDGRLEVLPRYDMGPVYTMEGAVCSG